MGVAPRRLLGWEPRHITEHVYDDAGRLVETVTHLEPEFDMEQVALLLAHMRHEKEPRGPHGLLLSEVTDPLADPANPDGWDYEVTGPRTDFAQRKLSAKKKAYYDKYPDAPKDAHLWSVRRIDPPPPPS